jgi:hypothetical protein
MVVFLFGSITTLLWKVGYFSPCQNDAMILITMTANYTCWVICVITMIMVTLSPPAVKTQWLSQCQAFQHLVRSSHTLVNWTFDLLNRFSISLACFLKTLNALCVCLQYKHPRSMKGVIRSDKPVTLLLLLWSHKCDFGAKPWSRIIATSAVKGLRKKKLNHTS